MIQSASVQPSSPASENADTAGITLTAFQESDPLGPIEPADAPASLSLTLDNAIAVSLSRNPALVSLRAGEPVATAAYAVSEVYPWNPFVQVQVLPYARERSGSTEAVNHYVWLMQTIELAHQQDHREASAAAAFHQVRWGIVSAELTTSAQTQRLYFTALYQRELRDLARRAAALNSELGGVVKRQFQAGLVTAAAQTTTDVAIRQSRRQAELAEANYRTAVLGLQRQLNLPPEEPVSLVGQLADFSWQPVSGTSGPGPKAPGVEDSPADDHWKLQVDLDFVAGLAEQRPDVLAAQSGVSVAHANADLARANEKQNIGFGPFYERDESGTVFAGFRTQMNLPVWDNGQPLTAQREAEQNRQWITFNQLREQAKVEAATAVERYERARHLLNRESFDQAEFDAGVLESTKQQFSAGQADILQVFAVQNALLQEHRSYLDLLNEIAQAAADVTQMAGLPPARLVQAKRGVSEQE